MPSYLVIVIYLAGALLALCIAAAVVEAVGAGRLGRLLGLDVREGDR